MSALDTTEKDRALRELEEEKQLRLQAKREEAQALLQQNLARSECDRLKEELEALKRKLKAYESEPPLPPPPPPPSSSVVPPSPSSSVVPPSREEEPVATGSKYVPLRSMTVSQVGDIFLRRNFQTLNALCLVFQNCTARVMTYDPYNRMLVVSKSSGDFQKPANGLHKVRSVM